MMQPRAPQYGIKLLVIVFLLVDVIGLVYLFTSPSKPSGTTAISGPTTQLKPAEQIGAVQVAAHVSTAVPVNAELPTTPDQRPTPGDPSALADTTTVPSPVPTSAFLSMPTPEPTVSSSVATTTNPRSIPILLYHYIRTVDKASDELGYNLSIAPELFAQHMAWLHDNGYTTVRIDTLTRCLRGQELCPAHAVALTFDDGYSDAYTAALPVLQTYGFKATFYIISGFVGHQGFMNWSELTALHNAGMEIGAHTVDHPDLTKIGAQAANTQITQSKADLEHNLGFTITSFCYPSGKYDAAIEQQVIAANYTSATTTRWDNNTSDVFALPRRRVLGGTGVKGFAAIVQG